MSNWGSIFWPILAFKALYWLLLVAGVFLWQEPGYGEIGRYIQRWPLEGGPSFGSHFANWDGGFYLYLSEVGYKAGDEACAFYPLFPLCVRWFSNAFGGDRLLFGLILANLLSAVGFALFFCMVEDRFNRPFAKLALMFLAFFPGSIFYQFIFSENLFLVLSLLLWLGLERQRYGLAAVAGFLLPLTRAIGIFSLLPIAWHCLSRHPPMFARRFLLSRAMLCRFLSIPNAGRSLDLPAPDARQALRAWSLLAAPLCGWGVYFAFMAWSTGNPFEGFSAQKSWGVHKISNLIDAQGFLREFFSPTSWHDFRGSILDRCIFVLFLFSLPWLWRFDKGLFVWALTLGLIPAVSGTLTSYTRFASTAFPMFIAWTAFFYGPERRAGRRAFLVVFAIGHAILLWRCTTCQWAG